MRLLALVRLLPPAQCGPVLRLLDGITYTHGDHQLHEISVAESHRDGEPIALRCSNLP
jgi:hypothetical protein